MQPKTQPEKRKSIRLTLDAFNELNALKYPHESYNQLIHRLCTMQSSLPPSGAITIVTPKLIKYIVNAILFLIFVLFCLNLFMQQLF